MRTLRPLPPSTLVRLLAGLALAAPSLVLGQLPALPAARPSRPIGDFVRLPPPADQGLRRRLCNDRHWVAIAPGRSTCPAVAGWEARPLFSERFQSTRRGLPLFCRYDWHPAAKAPGGSATQTLVEQDITSLKKKDGLSG